MDYIADKLKKEFFNEDLWVDLSVGILKLFVIFFLSRLVIRLSKAVISKFFLVRSKSPIRVSERREATLLKLIQNVITYIVNFIALIMALEVCGLDIKGLLAGAGIVGLAIGFGAQSLVKDIITGFFIILEDQFSVGDHIKVKDFEGEVLEIGLRTTKIKNVTGQLHVIPNGSILEVTNYSLLNSVAVVDVTLPYDGNVKSAEAAIAAMLDTLPHKYNELVKAPEILGIETLSPTEIVLRITAETLPNKGSSISRVLRKEVKDCLDQHEWNPGN